MSPETPTNHQPNADSLIDALREQFKRDQATRQWYQDYLRHALTKPSGVDHTCKVYRARDGRLFMRNSNSQYWYQVERSDASQLYSAYRMVKRYCFDSNCQSNLDDNGRGTLYLRDDQWSPQSVELAGDSSEFCHDSGWASLDATGWMHKAHVHAWMPDRGELAERKIKETTNRIRLIELLLAQQDDFAGWCLQYALDEVLDPTQPHWDWTAFVDRFLPEVDRRNSSGILLNVPRELWLLLHRIQRQRGIKAAGTDASCASAYYDD